MADNGKPTKKVRLSPKGFTSLSFRVAVDSEKKIVIITYERPVHWFSMSGKEAKELGEVLVKAGEPLGA